jgi:hypothetical protein
MSLKSVSIVLAITLLLAACSTSTPAPSTQAGAPTQKTIASQPGGITAYPAPSNQVTQPGGSTPYPGPSSATAYPSYSPYPEPGASGAGTTVIPISGYEPQPTDSKLTRDVAIVEMAESQLIITDTVTTQAEAVLVGTLPGPCHTLRVVVTPADASNIINIEAYSLVDPKVNCINRIESFKASIPLGNYASGIYTVNVNGSQLGQFVSGYAPQPGDIKLTRDVATVDIADSGLVKSTTQPNAMSAALNGYLPDPCHQLRIVSHPANSSGVINLEVYSVYDEQLNCIMVIEPFNVIYPMGTFNSGHYSVYVNGELLGEFDI